ncbi:hypothetical protein QL093DRAFT_2108449 [Fusarium oxysporum]|nr:hypothetical protein QL093DRAFT_2108449 [Fusarium oxysporum]
MRCALCVERLGRRLLLMISCAIMLISFILITGNFAQTGPHSVGINMIPFVFVFNAGYAVAVTPLQVAYPLELWPFQIRSRGLSVAWMIMILALIFNVFVNPIALSAIDSWPYVEEISVIFGDAPDGLCSDELDTEQVVEEADAKYVG